MCLYRITSLKHSYQYQSKELNGSISKKRFNVTSFVFHQFIDIIIVYAVDKSSLCPIKGYSDTLQITERKIICIVVCSRGRTN